MNARIANQRFPVALVAAAVGASLTGLSASGLPDPPENDDAVTMSAADVQEGAAGVTLSGYICRLQTCTGVRLLDPSGHGLQGCLWVPDPPPGTCNTGPGCSYCQGPGSKTSICVQFSHEECTFGAQGISNCGKIATNPCFYDATHALDWPCWCNNTAGTPTGDPCDIAKCAGA